MMRALTLTPGTSGSGRIRDVPEPPPTDGTVLVETLAIGVCGTDRELLAGDYGSPPPGCPYLVLGHESLGRVLDAPSHCDLSVGDLVVGIVRRPDPVPCPNCAVGEWDMCTNGRYTERGIVGLHGYGSERYRIEPEFAIKLEPRLHAVGVLLEPTTIVAKAWEQIERIGQRARWLPRRVLVTGAGPVGLLAALLGVQRGLEVHVLDRVDTGIKPDLVRALGGHYHTGTVRDACDGADIVLECTGVAQLVIDAMCSTAPGGIVCLAGLSSGRREVTIDAAALGRTLVLENAVVFGSVNANRRHYQAAAEALARADIAWLERLVTRRLPLDRWAEALASDPLRDVKTVLEPGS
jgi:threonine dehydrogenase-like Zn-dependent dehydrogenase